jgi:hypothetical protein
VLRERSYRVRRLEAHCDSLLHPDDDRLWIGRLI